MAILSDKDHNENFSIISKLYSVEFSLNKLPYLFQLKFRHEESRDPHIIVNEKSDILSSLYEGDIFEVNFYRIDSARPRKGLVQISHITKDFPQSFTGCYVVGLKLISDQNDLKNQ